MTDALGMASQAGALTLGTITGNKDKEWRMRVAPLEGSGVAVGWMVSGLRVLVTDGTTLSLADIR